MDILPNTHHYHTSVCVHSAIPPVPVVLVLPLPSQTQRGDVGEETAPKRVAMGDGIYSLLLICHEWVWQVVTRPTIPEWVWPGSHDLPHV